MEIQTQVELGALNTLAVPSVAQNYCQVQSEHELEQALEWAKLNAQPVHVLGGGSNVILPSQLAGLCVHNQIKGRVRVHQNQDFVYIKAGAGENWHEFVQWCLKQQYFGLENLALIPGTVGAAPVQNIGAYGVELEQYFVELEALDINSGSLSRFSREACGFGYRDSVFKREQKSRWVITQVTFALKKQPLTHAFYPSLKQYLKGQEASPSEVFSAVVAIRQARLPKPSELPNAGSFFKNPVVSKTHYEQLKHQWPELVAFDYERDQKKLAAAWLIDQAGWKGRELKACHMHKDHALVLCNPQKQNAQAIMALAQAVQMDIQDTFGVSLEIEPQLLGWEQHEPELPV